MNIPKIIHQIWIGPKTPPNNLMDTWKNKHEKEGFEYILWTEKEMKKRGFVSQLRNRLNEMQEFAGKADILRWEILYEYGGIYIDADSFCLEPITDLINKYKAFMLDMKMKRLEDPDGVRQENTHDVLASTHPLISNGTLAFPPKHELPRLAIEYDKKNNC